MYAEWAFHVCDVIDVDLIVLTSQPQADTPAQPVEEPEAKVRKKRRKPLANGGVANGVPTPQPQPAPSPPAPLAPALTLLPGDHAVVLGWEAASGANVTAVPAPGGLNLHDLYDSKLCWNVCRAPGFLV